MSDGRFRGSRSVESEVALVTRMARAMREKLELHSRKGHWSICREMYLAGRIADELGELLLAIDDGESPDKVWAEAGDIANLAAMLADNYEAGCV